MARILTRQEIATKSVMQVENNMVFGRNVGSAYDVDFSKLTKIGQKVDIEIPMLPTVVPNNMAYTSAAVNAFQMITIPLVVSNTLTSVFNMGDVQTALSMPLDKFSEKVTKNTTAMMANKYDVDLFQMASNAVRGGAWNDTYAGTDITKVSNDNAYRGVAGWVIGDYGVALTKDVILDAKAILADAGCPDDGDIYGILTPKHNAQLSNAQLGLFNAQKAISDIYMKGHVGEFAGIDFSTSANCATHTNGTVSTFTATNSPTNVLNPVSGTGANAAAFADKFTITASATVSGIAVGDTFTFAGVYAVNKLTKQQTPHLQQFTVVGYDATSPTLIEISPAPIISGMYQNISGTIANKVATIKGAAYVNGTEASSGQESIIYHKNAVQVVFGDLAYDPKVSHFERDDDIVKFALRYTQYFDSIGAAPGANGIPGWITRFDSLYGARFVRPEWAIRVRGGYAAP